MRISLDVAQKQEKKTKGDRHEENSSAGRPSLATPTQPKPAKLKTVPERPKKNAPQNSTTKKTDAPSTSPIKSNSINNNDNVKIESKNEGDGANGGSKGIVDAARLRVTKKVAADYPMISRKRKDQGTVVLLLSIKSGRVISVKIEKSSGHPALDQSAKKAVSAWEFDVSGFGDTFTARLPVVFSLTGR
jgi:protein TonB